MTPVIYDYPLNERVRTLLRLEFLFAQFGHAATGASEWDARFAFSALSQLQDFCARKELKSELGRELRRHAEALNRHRDSPGVDADALDTTLRELHEHAEWLYGPQTIDGTRQHEFLNVVRQRLGIPAGTCSFDLPALHHWLQLATAQRTRQFDDWLHPLLPVRRSTELILRLLRGSDAPQPALAAGGFYQQQSDEERRPQLLRAVLPAETATFPEFSGNQQRYSIRFMAQTELDSRPQPVREDVSFRLARCAL